MPCNGPIFRFRKVGYALNMFAVAWMAFMIALFSVPAVIPVTIHE